jgi:broad specificity phosphatase PhoE
MAERLILVRHGETVHNVNGIAQGWSDSELSDRGRTQIQSLASRIAPLQPTALYCSTLPRALATAEIISRELSLEIRQLDDLREMNCGRWEGMSFLDVRRDEAEFYRRWAADPTLACPDGESFHDVLQRLLAAFERIEKEGSARPVIVSHGTAIRIAATALLGLSLSAARHFAQDNAAVNVFDRRADRYIMVHWNDTSHYRGNGAG